MAFLHFLKFPLGLKQNITRNFNCKKS